MFMRTYASSRVKRKSFYRKSELQMFLLISSGDIDAPKQYTNNYGVSIQNSAKVREKFRQITQKLGATKTWDFDKLFIYLSFTTFHFLGFFHRTVSNLIFSCVTVKTIYVLTFDSHASALIASCIYKLDQINCAKHALNSNFLAILINEFIFSK